MLSVTLIVVGFVLAIVLVIVLALSSTARWEAARRSARAPGPEAGAAPPARPGHAAGGRTARLRSLAAAVLGAARNRPS